MVDDIKIKTEGEKVEDQPTLFNNDDFIMGADESLPLEINSTDIFSSEELILEHDFSSVGSFQDLSMYLEAIQDNK